MTEVSVVKESSQPLPAGVLHIPGAPVSQPAVVLKTMIGGVEHHWFVYREGEETDEDVARRVARTQRHITLLREKFGGEFGPSQPGTSAAAPSLPPATQTAETHDCPWHGVMKESTKAIGTYYCAHRMADGTWCKERWPKRAGDKNA
jgi:hypothetical protein